MIRPKRLVIGVREHDDAHSFVVQQIGPGIGPDNRRFGHNRLTRYVNAQLLHPAGR